MGTIKKMKSSGKLPARRKLRASMPQQELSPDYEQQLYWWQVQQEQERMRQEQQAWQQYYYNLQCAQAYAAQQQAYWQQSAQPVVLSDPSSEGVLPKTREESVSRSPSEGGENNSSVSEAPVVRSVSSPEDDSVATLTANEPSRTTESSISTTEAPVVEPMLEEVKSSESPVNLDVIKEPGAASKEDPQPVSEEKVEPEGEHAPVEPVSTGESAMDKSSDLSPNLFEEGVVTAESEALLENPEKDTEQKESLSSENSVAEASEAELPPIESESGNEIEKTDIPNEGVAELPPESKPNPPVEEDVASEDAADVPVASVSEQSCRAKSAYCDLRRVFAAGGTAWLRTWKEYFRFSGKISFSDFWRTVIANTLISAVLLFVSSLFVYISDILDFLAKNSLWNDYSLILLYEKLSLIACTIAYGSILVLLAYGLSVFIPMWALVCRRLRDTGRSALCCLIGFVPVVGILILLVFLCRSSSESTLSSNA